MAIEYINPPELLAPKGYAHIVTATGGKTIYLAGQGAYDVSGKLIGKNDLCAQTQQAVSNLLTALSAAGARPANVVKMNIYVVGLNAAALGNFLRGMQAATGETPFPSTASTMVGVEALAWDGMLVEIEAIAVIEA
ncbi:MAG: RidA family protein [Deltaproteobacteria bacterium]|nr:RidA family protein [Deltaproteobacteria bacterium]MBW2391249.1 RidA family protein [Deltaproteobacteria bacterium]MBW2722811.1 RidA family protein [Deltaproteobacteria bacterium]